MARYPSCQREVSSLHSSFQPSVMLRNVFRAPARRIFVCRNCGEELTLTFPSFVFCQIVFVVTVIPCAIVFARFYVFLTNSVQFFNQIAKEFPCTAVILVWILPTLAVTLSVYSMVVSRLVEFKKVSDF